MSPAVLLGIDTSAGISVAVSGPAGRAERSDPRPTAHAEQLSGLIRAAAGDAGVGTAELTGVVVGTGPAPFTGLRVGLMTARVLADALGIEVLGVCSLDVLALQVTTSYADAVADADAAAVAADGGFAVVTDARRREVYWARYRGDLFQGARTPAGPLLRVDGPGVAAPQAVHALLVAAGVGAPAVFGPGTGLYPEVFAGARGPVAVSAAAMLLGVEGGLLSTAPPEPRYLRRPDISPARPRSEVS